MSQWSGRLRELGDNFLAEDLDPRLSRVEVTGDRRVHVENHRGSLEYSDTVMRIALAGSELRITGHGLELSALTLTELTVSGTVCALEYIAG